MYQCRSSLNTKWTVQSTEQCILPDNHEPRMEHPFLFTVLASECSNLTTRDVSINCLLLFFFQIFFIAARGETHRNDSNGKIGKFHSTLWTNECHSEQIPRLKTTSKTHSGMTELPKYPLIKIHKWCMTFCVSFIAKNLKIWAISVKTKPQLTVSA